MVSKMPEKFDAAVVGAGPAGVTAALAMAKAGLRVILFERGEAPGQKNMFGGVLHYSKALNELIPDFLEHAPIERRITQYKTTMMAPDASFTVGLEDESFSAPPCNGFSLLRAKFDRWYALKAQEAGALLVTGTVVEDLLWKGQQVIGVRTGRCNGDILAGCVVLGDGANSLLAKKANMRMDLSANDFSVAAKEILALPKQVIEERFQLNPGEGLAHLFLGECTLGIEGGGFLYTNESTLSIGVVAKLAALEKRQLSIADLLAQFKARPIVKRAGKDAIIKEYSGHLVPEAGIRMVPQLYGNGVLVVGDAAGFVCSNGVTLQGMNLAMASGYAAATAVIAAKENRDYTANQLAVYERELKKDVVLKDMETYHRFPALLSNPNIYKRYPEMVCRMARGIYRVDEHPRKKLGQIFRTEAKGDISSWHLMKDLIQVGRAFL